MIWTQYKEVDKSSKNLEGQKKIIWPILLSIRVIHVLMVQKKLSTGLNGLSKISFYGKYPIFFPKLCLFLQVPFLIRAKINDVEIYVKHFKHTKLGKKNGDSH